MAEYDHYEIKAIVAEAVKQSAPQVIHDTLEHFGVDVSRPHETQADMHYLRKLRTGAQDVRAYLWRSAIWAACCGAAYLLWHGVKVELLHWVKGE